MPYTKEGIGYQNTDTSYEAMSPIKDKLILRQKIYNYISIFSFRPTKHHLV